MGGTAQVEHVSRNAFRRGGEGQLLVRVGPWKGFPVNPVLFFLKIKFCYTGP
jgi:hypothetical protein